MRVHIVTGVGAFTLTGIIRTVSGLLEIVRDPSLAMLGMPGRRRVDPIGM
jgi:hypothetical protein